MGNRLKRLELLGYTAGLGLVVAMLTITSLYCLAQPRASAFRMMSHSGFASMTH